MPTLHVRPTSWCSAAAIGAVVLLTVACTPTSSPAPSRVALASDEPTVTVAPTTAPTAAPSPTALLPAYARNPAPVVDGTPYAQAIDPLDFVAGVNHPFYPLLVGSKWVYEGDEHVEVTVLPETKLILGVAATVVRDQVFVDGELAEDTLDWYAQDRDGNVWYFGEQTAEYENGKVTSTAGSWEAGVNGSVPGIIMLAVPKAGDTYRQEFLAGEAEDMAEVTALTGEIATTVGSWSGADVLVTEEWTPLEPDVRERKTYARGVGLVETRTIVGGDEVTTLAEHTAP